MSFSKTVLQGSRNFTIEVSKSTRSIEKWFTHDHNAFSLKSLGGWGGGGVRISTMF